MSSQIDEIDLKIADVSRLSIDTNASLVRIRDEKTEVSTDQDLGAEF
jgi:hypothetical protein